MLDDMASALNRLRVTVRIVSPPQPDSASSSLRVIAQRQRQILSLGCGTEGIVSQQTTDLGPSW